MKKGEGMERRIRFGQISCLNWLMVGSKEPMPYTGKGQRPWRRQKATLTQCAFVLHLEFHSTAIKDVTVLAYFTYKTTPKNQTTYIFKICDAQLRGKWNKYKVLRQWFLWLDILYKFELNIKAHSTQHLRAIVHNDSTEQYSCLSHTWLLLSPTWLQTESILQIEQVQKEPFKYSCSICLLLKQELH